MVAGELAQLDYFMYPSPRMSAGLHFNAEIVRIILSCSCWPGSAYDLSSLRRISINTFSMFVVVANCAWGLLKASVKLELCPPPKSLSIFRACNLCEN